VDVYKSRSQRSLLAGAVIISKCSVVEKRTGRLVPRYICKDEARRITRSNLVRRSQELFVACEDMQNTQMSRRRLVFCELSEQMMLDARYPKRQLALQIVDELGF